MDPIDAFSFCPRCGKKLKRVSLVHSVCSSCGFEFYNNPAPSNAVLIENEEGEILFTKRKFDPKKGYWDLPGGFIHPGETVEESVIREVREELGIDVIPGKLIGIYPDIYDYQGICYSSLGITYSAKLKGGKIIPNDDVADYRFVPKNKISSIDTAFKGVRRGIEDYLKQSNTQNW